MEIRDAHHQGGQKDRKNVDYRFAPVHLWSPFGTAGQAQTGRLPIGTAGQAQRGRLPTANAYSLKRLTAAYPEFSGFGVEEVCSFDRSTTGKIIKQFSQ